MTDVHWIGKGGEHVRFPGALTMRQELEFAI
jgi:hypothetical protein